MAAGRESKWQKSPTFFQKQTSFGLSMAVCATPQRHRAAPPPRAEAGPGLHLIKLTLASPWPQCFRALGKTSGLLVETAMAGLPAAILHEIRELEGRAASRGQRWAKKGCLDGDSADAATTCTHTSGWLAAWGCQCPSDSCPDKSILQSDCKLIRSRL